MSTNSNRTFVLILLVVIALLFYRVSSGETIENFWGGLPMFSPAVDVIDQNTGLSVSQNNQNQLYVNPNPLINTSLLSSAQKATLTESLAPPGSASYQKYQSTLPQPPKSASTEYYSSPSAPAGRTMIPPTFTVPGTYQSYLSPRFNSEGYNSFVRYNLPNEKHLANRPNDPLMMADVVEKPRIREGFETTFTGNTPYQYNEIYDKQKRQGDEVANKLPVNTMTTNASASAGQDKNFFTTYDRFIFSLQRNRLQGQGDAIRGDVPVVPCNPSNNPYSNVWFRPSVNPSTSLRSGAINVIAGVGNVTAQQTAELQMRSLGGAKDTFAGVALNVPDNTPVSNLEAAQQAQWNRLNMGNSFDLTVDRTDPVSTVSTTSFP